MSTHTASKAPVQAGELVRLEYEIWNDSASPPELVETTREEVATQANWKAPDGFHYGPRAHAIGGDYFPTGIEASIAGAHVGEEVTKEFPPAEAFGEKDPKLIELFSMHEIERLPEMRREDAHLDIGTVLTIRGRRGRVVSLTAARVRVDFNPPLSGRKIRALFKISEPIQAPAEQAQAILEIVYGRGSEFKVESKGSTLELHVPERSKFDFTWLASKPRVIERLRQHLHPETIRIVEEYTTPPEPKAKPEAPAKAAHAPSAEAKEGEEAHAHTAHKGGHKPKGESGGDAEPGA
jgi:FKBP-type peptidyl-prolyl cis-trans isomerase 2